MRECTNDSCERRNGPLSPRRVHRDSPAFTPSMAMDGHRNKAVSMKPGGLKDFLNKKGDSLGRGSNHTRSTITTASTTASVSTFGTADSSVSSSSSKSVRWNDMLGGKSKDSVQSATCDFNKINLSESLEQSRGWKTLKGLKRELEKLENNIQEACKMELSYLNHADEARMKGKRWGEHLKSLKDKDRDLAKIEQLDAKVQKASKAEAMYLKKAKDLHDRRYRWTQIHRQKMKEWTKEGGPSRASVLTNVPPIRPPTTIGRSA